MSAGVPFSVEPHQRVPFYVPPSWVYPDMSRVYRKSYSEYTAFFNSVWEERVSGRLTIHPFRQTQFVDVHPTDELRRQLLDEVYKEQWQRYLVEYEKKGTRAKHDMASMWDRCVRRLEAEIWMALRRKYLWEDIVKARDTIDKHLSETNRQRRQVEQLHDILEKPSASRVALDEAANGLYSKLKNEPFIVNADRYDEVPDVSKLLSQLWAVVKP